MNAQVVATSGPAQPLTSGARADGVFGTAAADAPRASTATAEANAPTGGMAGTNASGGTDNAAALNAAFGAEARSSPDIAGGSVSAFSRHCTGMHQITSYNSKALT